MENVLFENAYAVSESENTPLLRIRLVEDEDGKFAVVLDSMNYDEMGNEIVFDRQCAIDFFEDWQKATRKYIEVNNLLKKAHYVMHAEPELGVSKEIENES